MIGKYWYNERYNALARSRLDAREHSGHQCSRAKGLFYGRRWKSFPLLRRWQPVQNRFDFISTEQELCNITGSTRMRSNGNKLLRRTGTWQGRTGTQQERTVGTCSPGAERWGAVWVYQWSFQESCLPPTLWLPVPVPSVPQQGWPSAPHSPALPRSRSCWSGPASGATSVGTAGPPSFPLLRSCVSRSLRGTVSSLALTAALSSKHPAQPGFLGTHTEPVAQGSSSPRASLQQEGALLQQPLLLCAQPGLDLEEMAAPQIQFEEIARAWLNQVT